MRLSLLAAILLTLSSCISAERREQLDTLNRQLSGLRLEVADARRAGKSDSDIAPLLASLQATAEQLREAKDAALDERITSSAGYVEDTIKVAKPFVGSILPWLAPILGLLEIASGAIRNRGGKTPPLVKA